MPTTVTSTSGTVYHLFQLQCSVKDSAETISFTTLDNDLADGKKSSILFGSDTGVRRWRLTMPTLSGASMDTRTYTSITGATVTQEEYLWDLFCETKITGEPFVYQSSCQGALRDGPS